MSDAQNAAGFRALESRIAMMKVLVDLPDECVPGVARAIEQETRRTIAAKTDPDGTPWPPKKTGGTDFTFVKASDIAVGSFGRTVILRIKSRPVVLHNNGYARGFVMRRVIPTKSIPKPMAAAIKRACIEEFRKITTTGGAT